MTKRTNLFPSLIKTREMNCLKIAGASLLLLCISPQFAVADGLKQDAVTIMQQQNLKVSGVVTDEAGEPLIGVSVLVKGTTLGNITDLNGRFSLDVPEGSILEISYIGYKTQSIKAQREPMNIVLKEDAQKLDEVVVVGFGTQKKVNLTGSVSAVTGDDISKRPVANAAILLQGQIPGLRVNQGLGQPGGEGTSFRIRGQGTFSSAGSDPLILINGVPGSMTNLDPSVIESVSVLKDAASAAIYGARAANGVILVTTKQGAVGDKVHISYHGNVGLHTPTKLYDRVTNSVEYMELANLAWKNSGTGKQYTQDQINLYRNNVGDPQYPNFDWQDYMFRTAVVQTHNLSMAGSTEKTTYNVALNFVDQPGTMRGFKYRKYNATIDLTARITNFIKVGTYANLMYGETEQPRQGQNDAFLSTLSQAPTYMPWLPDDGTGIRRWTSSAYSFESHNKNMPAIIGDNAMKRDNNFDINAQLWLEINLAKGLTWYTKGAARLQSNKSKDWRGSTTYTYDYHTGERSSELDKGGLGLSVGDGRRFYTNLYSYLKYD
ncbi:tonB-linked outer membrane, SusC/RagA family protein, partial [Bacteroides fragilis str. S6R6]